MSKRPKPRPSPALRLWNWAGIMHPHVRDAHTWYCQQLRALGLID